jgi:predicted transcriptional regulator
MIVLKAEILKTLRRLSRATLSGIMKGLPWQGIHPEIVRRYLLEFSSAGLVRVLNSEEGPVYELTKKGLNLVCFVISYIEVYGKVPRDDFASTPHLMELVHLSLKLGIIEEKRGLLSIMTTGCGELPTGRAVAGIICPNNHFIDVTGSTTPEYVVCPQCGERLKHIGQGMYVPANAVKETIFDWFSAVFYEVDRRISDTYGLPKINDWRPAMPHEGPFFMPARQARALWPNGWLKRVYSINASNNSEQS